MTRLATALCAIGATAVVAARAPAQSGQVFRSGVDVTTIDVTVIARNGDPIRDLKADDFTVTVDGKPRAIVSAQFVGFNEPSAGESRAVAPAAPRDYSANDRTARGRLIVLLVDQGNIRMGAERSVLRAAEGFLDRLTPSDRVSLLTIPTGPVIAFTGDRARIKNGLRHIVGQYRLPAIRHNIAATEALLIEDGDAETLAKVIERECGRGDVGCPQEIELEARGMAPEVRARGAGAGDGVRVAPGPEFVRRDRREALSRDGRHRADDWTRDRGRRDGRRIADGGRHRRPYLRSHDA